MIIQSCNMISSGKGNQKFEYNSIFPILCLERAVPAPKLKTLEWMYKILLKLWGNQRRRIIDENMMKLNATIRKIFFSHEMNTHFLQKQLSDAGPLRPNTIHETFDMIF